MAVVAQVAVRVVKTISGNSPMIRYYPEAASQSFKAGQFVYLSSGKVTVCSDDASSILGLAVSDATGVTDSECAVYIANTDTIFEGNVYHSTPASAVTAITQVGEQYALKVLSNKCYVDIEDTSHDAFQIVSLSERDAVGDQYGRVQFQVIDSVAQLRG